MLFNSFSFIIFLPLVFLLYWCVFKPLRWQNLFILAASYVFYGWWDPYFLILIFITTLCSWGSGILIGQAGENRLKRKMWCTANIILNLGILCYYKYFNFFADNLKILFSQFGYDLDWFTLEVLLPVGISFYTFQALSYTIDVYRNDISPTKDFIAFASFISFFPQLVAGPIERATSLLPQFLQPRHFDYDEAVSGMRQILWGFFKKMVIADTCAGLANTIFENYETVSGSTLMLGALFFTFQIYGDFSGYSDIAIGTAKLFGVRLTRNFNIPYFSRGIADFWRRWHISLNRWFIDYVYIPLGGSRRGEWRTLVNIMIIFSLSGLWHGADWTFVCWGVYNGVLVCVASLFSSKVLNRLKSVGASPKPRRDSNDFRLTFTNTLSIIGTFILVVFGWILFRADNMEMAVEVFRRIFNSSIVSKPDDCIYALGALTFYSIFILIAFLMTVEYKMRRRAFGLDISTVRYRVVRWGIYLGVLFLIMFFTGEEEQFIYFQF